MPNKRGAPKGNLNALKHGFYSPLFRPEEPDFPPRESASLDQEITLLRLMIRRTIRLANDIDDFKDAAHLLDVVSAAAARLANLMKTQLILQGSRTQANQEISAAIHQINQELRSKR